MHLAPQSRAPRFALALAAFAVPVLTLLFSTGGSTATTSSSYAAYPALSSAVPSELTLVASHGAPDRSARPTWPMSAPEGAQSSWPLSESIRKLSLETPNATAWIAQSLGGGVCVLLWAHQPAGDTPSIGASCSGESEEDIQRGATTQVSQIPGEAGVVYVAGVVPSTVSAVEVTLADGSTRTVAVKDNAWSIEAQGAPTAYRSIAVGG